MFVGLGFCLAQNKSQNLGSRHGGPAGPRLRRCSYRKDGTGGKIASPRGRTPPRLTLISPKCERSRLLESLQITPPKKENKKEHKKENKKERSSLKTFFCRNNQTFYLAPSLGFSRSRLLWVCNIPSSHTAVTRCGY